MKEPTFKIQAHSFLDAALAIEAGVKQGYKIEADDAAFFPQQFGHYFFLTMVSSDEQPVVEPVAETKTEPTVATRKRKTKTETSETEETTQRPDPVVLPSETTE